MISYIKKILSGKIVSNVESVSNNHITTLQNLIIKLSVEYDLLFLECIVLCENKFTFSKEKYTTSGKLESFYINLINNSKTIEEEKSRKKDLERHKSRIDFKIEKEKIEEKKCKDVLKAINQLFEISKSDLVKENYRIIKNIILELMVIYKFIDIEYNIECSPYHDHKTDKDFYKLEVEIGDLISLMEGITKEKKFIHISDLNYFRKKDKVVKYENLLIDNRFTLIGRYFSNLKNLVLSDNELEEILLLESNVNSMKFYRKSGIETNRRRTEF